MTDPLTGGTTSAEDMARSLLRYANRQKVADALIEQGYQTTRATVNRWARGDEMPGIAARMVLALFGHAPDTMKEPPPEWAGAMEPRLTAQLRLNQALIEDATPEEIAAVKAELDELRRLSPPPDARRPSADRHPQDGRAGTGQRSA